MFSLHHNKQRSMGSSHLKQVTHLFSLGIWTLSPRPASVGLGLSMLKALCSPVAIVWVWNIYHGIQMTAAALGVAVHWSHAGVHIFTGDMNTYPPTTMRRACRDFQQSGQGSAFEFGEAAERPLERYDVQVNIPSHISCTLQLGMHIIPLKVLFTHVLGNDLICSLFRS